MSNVHRVEVLKASSHVYCHTDELVALFDSHRLSSLAYEECLEVSLRTILKEDINSTSLHAHAEQREDV